MKGSNDPSNMIELSLREHFLAHWLLWKTYPSNLAISSAFLQMNNKNSKSSKPFQGRINSRTYALLKEQTYNNISIFMTDKVHIKDRNGNIITMSKNEYAGQTDYKFHTTGKIYALDTNNNSWVYITTIEYHANKHRYKTRLGTGMQEGQFQFLDTVTSEIVIITKSNANHLNQEYGYKRLKNIQKKNVKCINDLGEVYYVKLEEYDSAIHRAYNVDTVVVFDRQENTNKKITKAEYYLNKDRYMTSTKGKVLVKDSNGNTILVTQKEFKERGHVGQTYGYITVFNKEHNQYEQVTRDEFNQNRNKYTGPNVGKVNVIDKITGERKQIPKEQFDKNQYSGLGNKKHLFLCRSKLTGKDKFVNIYEWNILQHEYEILDVDKFNQAILAILAS
jgi:hypothetical protein